MNTGPGNRTLIYRISDFFQERFGRKVYRVTVDGGFTCPNRVAEPSIPCVFCDERGSGARHIDTCATIRVQYEDGKRRIRERFAAEAFLPYFQSFTNTYASTAVCLDRYRQVLDEDAVGIAIGTRPDCLADDLLEALGQIAGDRLVILDLGVQSMTDRVLEKVHRGHGSKETLDALERLRRWPAIHVCLHLIFGLPTETEAEMMDSLKLFESYPIAGLKLHQLNILEGTMMAQWYRSGLVTTLPLERYVSLVADYLERIPAHVVIHRLSARADNHSALLAPEWGRARLMPMQKILDELVCRGSHQGKFFGQRKGTGSNRV